MSEIAYRLSFSSQSHFIQQFRDVVGMTPKKYRDLHYMMNWDINEENGQQSVNKEDEMEK